MRDSYDIVAVSYAELVPAMADDHPVHRAVIDVFAELLLSGGGGSVADVGCGTGRVTAYLHKAGLDVSGIDLSPGMLDVARRDNPGLTFSEGSMFALDLPDAGLAGVLAWYSLVHTPLVRVPDALAQFHRVLAPGGYLQLGFHEGDRHTHKTEAYGHDGVSLDVYRLPIGRVCAFLLAAGFVVETEVVRHVAGDRAPLAAVLARKPDTP